MVVVVIVVVVVVTVVVVVAVVMYCPMGTHASTVCWSRLLYHN